MGDGASGAAPRELADSTGRSWWGRNWVARAASSGTTDIRPVQFRSVGGQKLDPDPPALLADEVPNYATAVRGQSVPDDQQLSGYVAEQMGEKENDLRRADGARKKAEVKVPPCDPCHSRKRLPVEVVL